MSKNPLSRIAPIILINLLVIGGALWLFLKSDLETVGSMNFGDKLTKIGTGITSSIGITSKVDVALLYTQKHFEDLGWTLTWSDKDISVMNRGLTLRDIRIKSNSSEAKINIDAIFISDFVPGEDWPSSITVAIDKARINRSFFVDLMQTTLGKRELSALVNMLQPFFDEAGNIVISSKEHHDFNQKNGRLEMESFLEVEGAGAIGTSYVLNDINDEIVRLYEDVGAEIETITGCQPGMPCPTMLRLMTNLDGEFGLEQLFEEGGPFQQWISEGRFEVLKNMSLEETKFDLSVGTTLRNLYEQQKVSSLLIGSIAQIGANDVQKLFGNAPDAEESATALVQFLNNPQQLSVSLKPIGSTSLAEMEQRFKQRPDDLSWMRVSVSN